MDHTSNMPPTNYSRCPPCDPCNHLQAARRQDSGQLPSDWRHTQLQLRHFTWMELLICNRWWYNMQKQITSSFENVTISIPTVFYAFSLMKIITFFIQISCKFVPKHLIENKSILVWLLQSVRKLLLEPCGVTNPQGVHTVIKIYNILALKVHLLGNIWTYLSYVDQHSPLSLASIWLHHCLHCDHNLQ